MVLALGLAGLAVDPRLRHLRSRRLRRAVACRTVGSDRAVDRAECGGLGADRAGGGRALPPFEHSLIEPFMSIARPHPSFAALLALVMPKCPLCGIALFSALGIELRFIAPV